MGSSDSEPERPVQPVQHVQPVQPVQSRRHNFIRDAQGITYCKVCNCNKS
jgi:hypothetical protein